MKFSNDKKLSLYIYTNDITKGSNDKMEIALKKELEATKSALRLQTMRCRQLVAAFTRKLHEKEVELRASKDLRDQQLSRLLRALLILESRLKKEQKLIRQQLEEKDLIIEKQEKEISRFKKFESCKNRQNSEDGGGREVTTTNVRSRTEAEHPLTTGEERLDNLCKGLLTAGPPHYRQDVESDKNKVNDTGCENRNVESIKKEENTFRDNPVLESVNQILLRDEEELLKNVQPVAIADKVIFNNGSDSSEWYETNSNVIPDERTTTGAWCINVEEGDEHEVRARKDVWTVEKTSPIKSQHLEEKACLEMSKKNLTVVDLEEIDSQGCEKNERAVSPAKSTASYEEIIPICKNVNYKPVRNLQKPPALPPKPARLLKPHQILQQKNPRLQAVVSTQKDSNSCQSASEHHGNNLGQINKINQVLPKKPVPNTFSQPATNTRHRHPEMKTSETVDVGKSRPKLPDPSLKPKRNQINGHVSGSLEVNDCVIGSQFGGKQQQQQKKKEESIGNCGAIKIGSSVSSLITGLSRETIVTELSGEPATNPPTDDSHVSQLVRQFEVLGKLGVIDAARGEDEVNDLRKNFEEFKLEESYVDSVIETEENGRHEGDGAENRNIVNYYASLTIVPPPLPKDPPPGAELEYKMYETFLENTGLSQKSILTPSRMLSNHRSCLKPKDVKHRSRVKAAAAIEKCNTANGGSTVKYWTEPFL